MAIGSLPPVISEIQANSGQPGKTLAQQAASSLLDVQAAATTEPAIAILPETTLIEKAVAEALGRQGGLAPLFATLAKLADAPDLPDAVKAAVNTVLAFGLGDGEVTPTRVAEAIRSSGLFHEAVVAGKMTAVLPPAVRQALAATPEEVRQVVARAPTSASSPAPQVTAARPVSSPPIPTSPPPVAGRPSMGAQVYASQGGPVSQSATQANMPAFGAAGVAAGPPAMPGAPPVTPTATVLPATPSANPAVPPSSVSTPGTVAPLEGPAAALAQPTANGGTSGISPAPTANPPSLPAAGLVSQNSPVPQQIQAPTQGQAAAGADGVSAPPPVSRAEAPLPSSASPLPTPISMAVQLAGPSTPAPGNTPPSSAPIVTSTAESPEPSAPGPSSPAGSSASAASTASSSRAFAPWTPGRPLAPATPPVAISASPTVGPPSDANHVLPLAPTAPAGGETIPHRLPGDRAPFVPSAVDSLPNASAEPVASPKTPIGSATSPTTQETQTKLGVAPPPGSASPPQPETRSPAGLGVPQSQQAPPQARAAPATGAERLAPSAPQPSASTPAVPAPAMPVAGGVDLKGALDVLRRELVAWLGRNADVMASLDGSSDDPIVTRVDRPSPPRKGGPVRGQPAVRLPDGGEAEAASTEVLAGRALSEAERSLSRVFLHQAATAESRDMKAAQPTQALMLEIPITGPNGTSIAQLRIERDDRAPAEPGAPPRRVFQVDIAFDIVPLGPVAVRVGLMDGRRVAVGVWCESDDGLVRMEAERENIVLGLEQEGMVVAGVDLHRGHPPEGRDETAVASSHRLDLQL